jgi:hypothetical protein
MVFSSSILLLFPHSFGGGKSPFLWTPFSPQFPFSYDLRISWKIRGAPEEIPLSYLSRGPGLVFIVKGQ